MHLTIPNCDNKSQTRTCYNTDKSLLQIPFQISNKASDNLSSIGAQIKKRESCDKSNKGKVGILKNYLKRNNLS